MRFQHLSAKTARSYGTCVRRFTLFHSDSKTRHWRIAAELSKRRRACQNRGQPQQFMYTCAHLSVNSFEALKIVAEEGIALFCPTTHAPPTGSKMHNVHILHGMIFLKTLALCCINNLRMAILASEIMRLCLHNHNLIRQTFVACTQSVSISIVPPAWRVGLVSGAWFHRIAAFPLTTARGQAPRSAPPRLSCLEINNELWQENLNVKRREKLGGGNIAG